MPSRRYTLWRGSKMIVDANMYWVPESLFTSEEVLARFVAEVVHHNFQTAKVIFFYNRLLFF